jgi:hypothetical protein
VLHWHKCPECGHVWKHDGGTYPWPEGFHECPACGEEDVRDKHWPEGQEKADADAFYEVRYVAGGPVARGLAEAESRLKAAAAEVREHVKFCDTCARGGGLLNCKDHVVLKDEYDAARAAAADARGAAVAPKIALRQASGGGG